MTSAASSPPRSYYAWFTVNGIALAVLIFAILVMGAGPGTGGGAAALLRLALGLAFLPGLFSGLLQAVVLPPVVRGSRVRWVIITLVSAAIGWGIALGLYTFYVQSGILPREITSLPSAIFMGIAMGGGLGIPIGLVVGFIQTTFGGPLLDQRAWMAATTVSWWFGVTAPLMLLSALLSQMKFTIL